MALFKKGKKGGFPDEEDGADVDGDVRAALKKKNKKR